MPSEVCTIGLDLAKNVFQVHGPQVHGADASGRVPVHAMSSSDDRALRSGAIIAWREIAEPGIAAQRQGAAPRLRTADHRQVYSTLELNPRKQRSEPPRPSHKKQRPSAQARIMTPAA
jgi:hypothetical protein